LKCNNCGHLNDVKSEYLIFCDSCGKKLENNFRDWKNRNSDSTLDDFKKLMCVSEDEMIKNSVKTKKKPKSLKYWIGFALFFAIFYAVGQFGGEAIVRFFNSEKTEREVLDQKWIKETYGNFGLSVETPVILTKADIPIPDEVKQVIDQMDSYTYASSKGFKVYINSVKYNPIIGEANLQGAANGSVNEMKMQKGVTDFDYSEDYIFNNSIPGFIQKGTFKHKGIGVEFVNTGFLKGLVFYQVNIIYQDDDEVGRTAAKRVIDSIKINDNSNAL
jgi:hypothetical protein